MCEPACGERFRSAVEKSAKTIAKLSSRYLTNFVRRRLVLFWLVFKIMSLSLQSPNVRASTKWQCQWQKGNLWMQRSTRRVNKLHWFVLPDLCCRDAGARRHLKCNWTKLNARLALRQRADTVNILANKISLPQGQSYTEGKCYNGYKNLNLKIHKWLMIN